MEYISLDVLDELIRAERYDLEVWMSEKISSR